MISDALFQWIPILIRIHKAHSLIKWLYIGIVAVLVNYSYGFAGAFYSSLTYLYHNAIGEQWYVKAPFYIVALIYPILPFLKLCKPGELLSENINFDADNDKVKFNNDLVIMGLNYVYVILIAYIIFSLKIREIESFFYGEHAKLLAQYLKW
jgi:hypothetical protein